MISLAPLPWTWDGIPSSDRHVCLAWVWRQVAKELIMAGADPTIKNKAKPVLPHKGTTDPEIYELAKLVHAFEDSNQVGTCACQTPLICVSCPPPFSPQKWAHLSLSRVQSADGACS